MALTYRKVKGSALTIDELDANFAHFTGSHSITGSLTVSGSIIPSEVNGTLGTATAPWKELFVDGGTIYFISGSSSGSLGWSSGSGFNFGTGSVTFDGGLTVTGSVTISGSSTLTNIGPFRTTGESTFNGDIWVKSTSGNVGELLITSLTNNHTSSFYTDNSGNLNIVSNGSSVVFKAGNNGVQATIPFTASSAVSLPSISNTAQPHVLGYDSTTGNVTYYSTASFGGGSSTDTGSLLTTASVSSNIITFTKGDASTFNITVDTGSASGTFDGGLTVTGSLIVSGSANSVFDIDLFDLQITGGLDVSRDVAVRDDLTVYDDTNLRKDVNVGFRGDNPGFGYSLSVTQSTNTSGSARFIGGITMETLPTTEPNVTGSLWISGSSLSHPNSGYLMIFNP